LEAVANPKNSDDRLAATTSGKLLVLTLFLLPSNLTPPPSYPSNKKIINPVPPLRVLTIALLISLIFRPSKSHHIPLRSVVNTASKIFAKNSAIGRA
jgi:hypothetical protein